MRFPPTFPEHTFLQLTLTRAAALLARYKALHTFSTMNRLMDAYPEMVFSYSQPASYDAVARLSPALMARARASAASPVARRDAGNGLDAHRGFLRPARPGASPAARLPGELYLDYAYAARGDGQATNEPLSTEAQRAALAAVAQTWQPAFLTLPEKVIAAIPPLPPGYERDRELFDPHTGLVFDPMAAAESWVNAVLDLLFNPQRLSRIVEQNARGKSVLSLSEVFDAVLKTGEIDERQSPYEQELARMVERQGLEHLFRVAVSPDAQQQVCAEALRRIGSCKRRSPAALPPTRAAGATCLPALSHRELFA